MTSRKAKAERVGVRELRQNLSVYLKRVREDGRAYEVTERGEPVARLAPLEDRPASAIEQMVADGRATAPTRRWEDLPSPMPSPPGKSASETLIELRDEERW